MKKLSMLFLIFSLACTSLTGYAANGDVIGAVYATDIRAYINGVEVPSYNIGGKTAVVIEDITNAYSYNNDTRSLRLTGLAPDSLKGGSSQVSDTPGTPIGNVYATDIKTSLYGVEVTSYNIGGKTAVAIEDLGNDGAFSEVGGKYTWDAIGRTISLEFLYNTTPYWETGTIVTVTFNDDLTEGTAEFRYPVSGNGELHFNWPDWASDLVAQASILAIIPITAEINGQKAVIGYHFIHPSDIYNLTAFTYFYEDKYEEAVAQADIPALTREEIINYYLTTRACTVIEQFDTETYSFLYMSGPNMHGGTQYLLLVNTAGTYHDYARDFESVSLHGEKIFEDVRIDRENEKVYLHYDIDYVIDLKTGEMQKL